MIHLWVKASFKTLKTFIFTYQLLSKLGEDILYRGVGYIVTKKDEDFQILLYEPLDKEKLNLYNKKNSFFKNGNGKKVSINISNMYEDYKITKYELNNRFGSIYDKWIDLGKPKRLNRDEWELLNNYVHPDVTFCYGKKSTIYNLLTEIKDMGIVLYNFQKVQR